MPCPSPLPTALKDERMVDAQRNLYCLQYDACLHLAVKRGWEGWTCAGCPLKEWRRDRPSVHDYAHARPGAYDGQ